MVLRKVSPTAMGRIPPSFLFSGIRLEAHITGANPNGRYPYAAFLTIRVIAASSSLSVPSFFTHALMCPGRKPEGPGAEPGGKEKMALRVRMPQLKSSSFSLKATLWHWGIPKLS